MNNKVTVENTKFKLIHGIIFAILYIFIILAIYPLLIKYLDNIISKIMYGILVFISLIIGYWLCQLAKKE